MLSLTLKVIQLTNVQGVGKYLTKVTLLDRASPTCEGGYESYLEHSPSRQGLRVIEAGQSLALPPKFPGRF